MTQDDKHRGVFFHRSNVLRSLSNICAKLLEMLAREWEMRSVVIEAVQQWGRYCPCFAVPEPKPGDWGPRTCQCFLFRTQPKPNLVSLSWAARQEDLRSCEGRNLRGKDSAKPPALPAGRAGSGCGCWSVVAAVLAGQETALHLSPSRVSIARDFSDVPCQQSFLIKILNQASDHQFQTRSWQPWELLQVAMV